MAAPECARTDDVASYALGALDPATEGEMTAHIESCPRCRSRLRWFSPALETLPESVEQLAPPPRLRRNLMETVRAEAAPAGETTPTKPARWRSRRLRVGGFAFGPATALAASLVLVAALVGYEARDTDPSSRTVAVSAGPPGSHAELKLGGGQATFVAQRVPRLPRGDVYQVWVRHGQTVEASSTFKPDRAGSAVAPVPEAAEDADQVMITREPRTALPPSAPSSPPIYTATLRS